MTKVLKKLSLNNECSTVLSMKLTLSNVPTEPDIDLYTLLLTHEDKVHTNYDCAYYNNNMTDMGSVALFEDNYEMKVNYVSLPENIERILFIAAIYQSDASIEYLKDVTEFKLDFIVGDGVILHSDLKSDILEDATGMILASLTRINSSWNLELLGSSFTESIFGVLSGYGVDREWLCRR